MDSQDHSEELAETDSVARSGSTSSAEIVPSETATAGSQALSTHIPSETQDEESDTDTDEPAELAETVAPREKLGNCILNFYKYSENDKKQGKILGQVKTLLEKHPEIININDNLGYPPLHEAIVVYLCLCYEHYCHEKTKGTKIPKKPLAQLIDLLLSQQGIDVNAKSIGGISPLVMFLEYEILPENIDLTKLDYAHDRVIQTILSNPKFDPTTIVSRSTQYASLSKSQKVFLTFVKKCIYEGLIDLYENLAAIFSKVTWRQPLLNELGIDKDNFSTIFKTFTAIKNNAVSDATINLWLKTKYNHSMKKEELKDADHNMAQSLVAIDRLIEQHNLEPLLLILLERVKRTTQKH